MAAADATFHVKQRLPRASCIGRSEHSVSRETFPIPCPPGDHGPPTTPTESSRQHCPSRAPYLRALHSFAFELHRAYTRLRRSPASTTLQPCTSRPLPDTISCRPLARSAPISNRHHQLDTDSLQHLRSSRLHTSHRTHSAHRTIHPTGPHCQSSTALPPGTLTQ
jgi:hypothetical protein